MANLSEEVRSTTSKNVQDSFNKISDFYNGRLLWQYKKGERKHEENVRLLQELKNLEAVCEIVTMEQGKKICEETVRKNYIEKPNGSLTQRIKFLFTGKL